MMRVIKTALLLFTFTVFMSSCRNNNAPDTVKVSGIVSDFEGNPLGNVMVAWKDPGFNDVVKTTTDEEGRYEAELEKGKYYSMIAVNFDHYPHTAGPELDPQDMRLEFWGWNYIADRDTTWNIRYNRLEVYGLNAFHVQGAVPGFTVYFRPMSLTKVMQWSMNDGDPYMHCAPHPENANIKVWIDGQEVPVNMVQLVKEYIDMGSYADAYIMHVGRPEKETDAPYYVFRVEMTDLENGDRGEGIYFLEKENYVKQLK